VTSGSRDQRVLFDPGTPVEPMRRPVAVPVERPVLLTAGDVRLLRDGLGRIDMDLRWMVHLADDGALRLYRSWTGHEVYRATVSTGPDGGGEVTGLQVETYPDRHRWTPTAGGEPAQFLRVLGSTLDLALDLAAGFWLYPPFPAGLPPSSTRRRDW